MTWRHDLDPWNLPSGSGTPSKATRIWRDRQRELAASDQIRICVHCGHTLHEDETDYCRLCQADISEDGKD